MLTPLEIFIAIIIAIVLCRMIKIRRENYAVKRGYCPKYRYLGRSVPYLTCEEYGYVVPVRNPNSRPIKLYKCKIGLPSHTMKYRIVLNELDRFTPLFEYNEMGAPVGSHLRFDNGKEYRIISTDPNVILN